MEAFPHGVVVNKHRSVHDTEEGVTKDESQQVVPSFKVKNTFYFHCYER
jgi:hypothetical protein